MMPGQPAGPKPTMGQVVRFVIDTLGTWARGRNYGTIRIVVQKGKIEFVHVDMSYTLDNLPVKPVEQPGG